jgi:hypothetical protein
MDLQDTPPVNPVILSKLFDFFAKFVQEITVKLLTTKFIELIRKEGITIYGGL